MEHKDHVALLQDGVAGHVWADFGAGAGAFTLALADLLRSQGEIYAIDANGRALEEQRTAMHARFPAMTVHFLQTDFTKPLTLPPLDGIVMANSLHFIRQKEPTLERVFNYLKPGGRLIMVEYDGDVGNTWVPYPFSYTTWEKMATRAGFIGTRKLNSHPSRFLKAIYSALSLKP